MIRNEHNLGLVGPCCISCFVLLNNKLTILAGSLAGAYKLLGSFNRIGIWNVKVVSVNALVSRSFDAVENLNTVSTQFLFSAVRHDGIESSISIRGGRIYVIETEVFAYSSFLAGLFALIIPYFGVGVMCRSSIFTESSVVNERYRSNLVVVVVLFFFTYIAQRSLRMFQNPHRNCQVAALSAFSISQSCILEFNLVSMAVIRSGHILRHGLES